MSSGSDTRDWSFFQGRSAPGNGLSAVSCSVAGEKEPNSSNLGWYTKEEAPPVPLFTGS